MRLILNLEMPPSDITCGTCGEVEGQFCCSDCYRPHWWCETCLLKSHIPHPFHCPQQWRNGSFERVELSDLGYIFALGHLTSGSCCPDDENFFGDRRMTLVHVNGVFQICVRFCRCQGASSEHEQLFCHQLFSSTFNRPETAFTLDVLDHYRIDAMECKTSVQAFFQKLRRVTNNAFPDDVLVCILTLAPKQQIFN